ncbi:AAA family ATPase [Moraxella porci]|uniref:AAA family ATPase n=1 Tax=Moraxella porci TaxID=1288392 RepID=UPI002449EC33|nr:AAA family ATPase [Moraxella porci]MDH2274468.1 AAA family ATPase [Moraxella porci]
MGFRGLSSTTPSKKVALGEFKVKFQILDQNEKILSDSIILQIDRWNDYSFVTMFYLSYYDSNSNRYDIGNVKIGFQNQTTETATYQKIKEINNNSTIFETLPDYFFSLGGDVEYYKNLWKLPDEIKSFILYGLNDIVQSPQLFENFQNEDVMQTSLLRYIRENTVKEQFARILQGKSELTNFNFFFIREETESIGGINLEFNVLPETNPKPSTNIHAIIGRNGVGKTTLLNGMIRSFLKENNSKLGKFCINNHSILNFNNTIKYKEISDDYFSYLVAVSFSVFDPFIPQDNKDKNYFYIGLKDNDTKLKEPNSYFEKDFWSAFELCQVYEAKKQRWLKAIKTLESDNNFASMNLSDLIYADKNKVLKTIHGMSSGHASVLLIITQLVAKVEEKTLVLLDEPESHLHPPLLSAFIRALSELLDNRNGVAIVATHSPVVLQEIPKSCVWKIVRTGKTTKAFRLCDETFGENIGVLTREVFGLEVEKSGFHRLLNDSVNQGGSYEEILASYNGQLGREGKLLLKTLIRLRDEKKGF